MRVVIQRVAEAAVTINGQLHASIRHGLLLLLGIEEADTEEDAAYLIRKINTMRIFSDHTGKMNLDIHEVKGEFLVVSQFTLHASTKKGNRPSFIKAALPEKAIPFYQHFLSELNRISGTTCQAGIFGADMKISLINDGPVTIILDSRNKE